MKKRYITLVLIFGCLFASAQQDPQFNLYQFNQMVINPAYAGARDAIAVVGDVRNQWTGFEGAPRTSCLSIHGPIANKHIGIGLTVVNDVMGPRNLFGIYGNFAYILKLSNKYKLSFGINGGLNRFQFDFSKISFKSYETSTSFYQVQNYNKLDINSGIYLRSNTFFAGLSTTHLYNGDVYNISDSSSTLSYRLRTHMFFTLGKSFSLGEKVIFAPTLAYRVVNSKANGDLNLNFFLFKKLWLGVFSRGGYGPGFLLQYYINDKIRVGYSFDTGSRDARKLGPSHEVMFGIDLGGNKSKVISPRFL